MLLYTFERLQARDDLAPLRAAGHRVFLHGHARSVWACSITTSHPGTFELEHRIDDDGWYLPLRRSRGEALAGEMAASLLHQWARFRELGPRESKPARLGC